MGIGNNISFVIAIPSEVFKGERYTCGSEKKNWVILERVTALIPLKM